jgi:hypothetical protein
MASRSGNNANTSQELVLYEPTTCDLVNAEEKVNHPSATVCNPPAWITQLFACLQKAEEDVRLVAEAREEEDVMEIHIFDMCSYYKTLTRNESELFWEITQNDSFESALVEESFNNIVRDCQIFGNQIWTAITGSHRDAEGNEDANIEYTTRINDDLRLLTTGDDDWKKPVHI